MVAALALRRLRAARPRDRRPDRRAGARGAAARLRRGEGGRARRGRAGQLDLRQRTHGVRARAGARVGGAGGARRWPRPTARGGCRAQRARERRWTGGGAGGRRDARSRPDEVPDRAAGELAALRRLRQRADRDRSPPALPPLRRPAGDAASPADLTARRAARALHRATRQRPGRDRLGCLAIPRDRPSVGGAGRIPSRGQHAAAPPRGAGPLDRRRRTCCSSTRATTRPARSRTAA